MSASKNTRKPKPNRLEQKRARAHMRRHGGTYLQALEYLRKYDNPDQDGTYPGRAAELFFSPQTKSFFSPRLDKSAAFRRIGKEFAAAVQKIDGVAFRRIGKEFAAAVQKIDGVEDVRLVDNSTDLEVALVTSDLNLERELECRRIFIATVKKHADASVGELSVYAKTEDLPAWLMTATSLLEDKEVSDDMRPLVATSPDLLVDASLKHAVRSIYEIIGKVCQDAGFQEEPTHSDTFFCWGKSVPSKAKTDDPYKVIITRRIKAYLLENDLGGELRLFLEEDGQEVELGTFSITGILQGDTSDLKDALRIINQ